MLVDYLHGKDKVRTCFPSRWRLRESTVGESDVHGHAGQPGTVLQIHAAPIVHGPCVRVA